MWCIVWNISGITRQDLLTFDSYEKTHIYAKYYKQVMELHASVIRLGNRFKNPSIQPFVMTYEVIQKISRKTQLVLDSAVN